MQLRLASPALAGLFAGVLALPAISQNPDAIEDVYPASSFGFVQFGGLKACVEAAEQLGLVIKSSAKSPSAWKLLLSLISSSPIILHLTSTLILSSRLS